MLRSDRSFPEAVNALRNAFSAFRLIRVAICYGHLPGAQMANAAGRVPSPDAALSPQAGESAPGTRPRINLQFFSSGALSVPDSQRTGNYPTMRLPLWRLHEGRRAQQTRS